MYSTNTQTCIHVREPGFCMSGKVNVRTATSNSLRALSHSFCPAACWVQSVISWLILSVTALKHTGSQRSLFNSHMCRLHAHTGLALLTQAF